MGFLAETLARSTFGLSVIVAALSAGTSSLAEPVPKYGLGTPPTCKGYPQCSGTCQLGGTFLGNNCANDRSGTFCVC